MAILTRAHGHRPLRCRRSAPRVFRRIVAHEIDDRRRALSPRTGIISVGVSHAINPYCYRCPLGMKYPDCGVACANDVENLIQTGTSGQIAAFIAEPIQGVGGFITPPPEYFKIVFQIVKKYGGLFISDEVQTGFGRTGKTGSASSTGKSRRTSSLAPKAWPTARRSAQPSRRPKSLTPSRASTISTFGGNPVTSVAARATIEVIEEENLLDNADVVGDYFRGKLDELKEKHARDRRRARNGADARHRTRKRPPNQRARARSHKRSCSSARATTAS